MLENFFTLTPDRVLDSVERSGHLCTGMCYPLNSLENRVYEVELEDGTRRIAKFYRPSRWTADTILDEHRMLAGLMENEIPVAEALAFPDGDTLHQTPDGIFFALFPKRGGRSPDELNLDEYAQLGRLLGRIHNVSDLLGLTHRPELTPETYGRQNLAVLLERGGMGPGLKERFEGTAKDLIALAEERFAGVPTVVAHADCHKGNLLRGPDGWFFLDFDDMASAPPVQDLWLLLPARAEDAPSELEAMLGGYEQFREFRQSSTHLIEVLRALRYLRYAGWIAKRWEDPAFSRAFPDWGTDNYWQGLLSDLHEQLRVLSAPAYAY